MTDDQSLSSKKSLFASGQKVIDDQSFVLPAMPWAGSMAACLFCTEVKVLLFEPLRSQDHRLVSLDELSSRGRLQSGAAVVILQR